MTIFLKQMRLMCDGDEWVNVKDYEEMRKRLQARIENQRGVIRRFEEKMPWVEANLAVASRRGDRWKRRSEILSGANAKLWDRIDSLRAELRAANRDWRQIVKVAVARRKTIDDLKEELSEVRGENAKLELEARDLFGKVEAMHREIRSASQRNQTTQARLAASRAVRRILKRELDEVRLKLAIEAFANQFRFRPHKIAIIQLRDEIFEKDGEVFS